MKAIQQREPTNLILLPGCSKVGLVDANNLITKRQLYIFKLHNN